MASNPMQRKSRNSFLAGVLVAFILSGAIVVFLIMEMNKIKEEKESAEASQAVYILNKDVQSGEEVTMADFTLMELPLAAVPVDTLDVVNGLGTINTSKIALSQGVVALNSMFNIDEEQLTGDVRTEEFNMITLPIDLQTGEYVDIRITFPSGVSYVVLSKKKVEIPVVGDMDSVDTVRMQLSEEEINVMSSAIIEAYQIPGTKIYANKYVEAGIQAANQVSYVVNEEAIYMMVNNPNLLAEAKVRLEAAYLMYKDIKGNAINQYLDSQEDGGYSNVESGVNSSIVKSQEEREEYLESMQYDMY